MHHGTVQATGASTDWRPGDPEYRRITLALFLAGLATFALAGSAWSAWCWPGVAALSLGLVLVALALAVSMRWVPPAPARPFESPQP